MKEPAWPQIVAAFLYESSHGHIPSHVVMRKKLATLPKWKSYLSALMSASSTMDVPNVSVRAYLAHFMSHHANLFQALVAKTVVYRDEKEVKGVPKIIEITFGQLMQNREVENLKKEKLDTEALSIIRDVCSGIVWLIVGYSPLSKYRFDCEVLFNIDKTAERLQEHTQKSDN